MISHRNRWHARCGGFSIRPMRARRRGLGWRKCAGNLVRLVAPELIQDAFTPESVAREVRRLLDSPDARAEARAGLEEVRAKLGPGGAIERAADIFAGMM